MSVLRTSWAGSPPAMERRRQNKEHLLIKTIWMWFNSFNNIWNSGCILRLLHLFLVFHFGFITTHCDLPCPLWPLASRRCHACPRLQTGEGWWWVWQTWIQKHRRYWWWTCLRPYPPRPVRSCEPEKKVTYLNRSVFMGLTCRQNCSFQSLPKSGQLRPLR